MTHHWPIAVSALLISGALALGMYQHENAITTSALKTPESSPPVSIAAPAVPPAAVPVPQDTVPAAAPTPQAPQVQPAQPVQPIRTIPVEVPKPIITKPVLPQPAQLPNGGRPGVPQAASLAQQILLTDLRKALPIAVDAPPFPLPGGGYACSPLGARIDVLPPPNWSIIIYNINGKTPEAETDSYKQCIAAVTTTLAIDMSPQPIVTDTGKSSLKTTCKLGRISIDREPANGNVFTITPLQQRAE